MVEGELCYVGLFFVKLEQQELIIDGDGNVKLELFVVKELSCYVVIVFVNDGVVYCVKVMCELLIVCGVMLYKLLIMLNFIMLGQNVLFMFMLILVVSGVSGVSVLFVKWDLVCFEMCMCMEGMLVLDVKGNVMFLVKFDQLGLYMLLVCDVVGNLFVVFSYWVVGDGVQIVLGNIEMVFDCDCYQIGDMVEVLIMFLLLVDDVLFMLECDKVECYVLFMCGGEWFSLQKVMLLQYCVCIKIGVEFVFNMMFLVLYVCDGDMVFQNVGIVVMQLMLDLGVYVDKVVYVLGEIVMLDLISVLVGKFVLVNLIVLVVDEMIYVLQFEVVFSIVDFFYYLCCNSVCIILSQSFISYDLVLVLLLGKLGGMYGCYNECGVKVLECLCCDEKDIVVWVVNLQIGVDGCVCMIFKMLDLLVCWCIMVCVVFIIGVLDGIVGQCMVSICFDKLLYLKWIGL